MPKIRCVIIEDEKPAQEILISFLTRVEWIELKATFDDALTALDYLKTHEIDLLFLDIQIPSLTGIEFLKIVKDPPQVIITSAYSQYAIDAFDLDVRDYLMKPFSFERFLKAINRITPNPEPNQIYQLGKPAREPESSFAFFNVNKTMVRVQFDQVTFIESMREYVYIHTREDKIITKIGIGEMEKMLEDNFLRVHRSYIINLDKVTAYNAEELFIQKISIPIGTNYKKIVESALQKVSKI